MNSQPTQDPRLGLPSASSFDRLYHCPGSLAAEKDLPPLPVEETAEFGTNVHEALETGEDQYLEVDEKEVAAKLRAMEEAELAKWKEDFGVIKCESIRETRLWIRTPDLELLASAQVDVAFISVSTHDGGRYALILDAKTGFNNPTPSERNWQVRVQAVALKHTYHDLRVIRAGTMASRLSSKMDTTDHNREDLQRINHEIVSTAWRAEQPGSPRVPGSWCRYCKARGLCRESSCYAMVVIQRKTLSPKGKLDQMALIQAVDRMTPAELAYVFERKSVVKATFEAIEARMKGLPKEELEAVGYKVVDGNKNKVIVDVPTAFTRLGTVLDDSERAQCIDITRGKAIEILAAKQGVTKKAATQLINETIGDAMIEKPGNPKLKKV